MNVILFGVVWFLGGLWDNVKKENFKFYVGVEKVILFGCLGIGEEIVWIIVFVVSLVGIWLNVIYIVVDGG